MLHLVAVFTPDFAAAVKTNLADPLLNGMKFLIPAIVTISALHKLAEHRENGVHVLLDVLIKAVAAVAVITVVQNLI